MDVSIYIAPFLKAFGISVFLIYLFLEISKRVKSNGRESKRHIHGKNVSRLGGAAIVASFLIVVFGDSNLLISQPMWGIIIGSIVILLLGLWDDFRELEWKIQLFFQLCAAVVIFIFGVQIEYITNPFGGLIYLDFGNTIIPSLLFGVAWIILMMNSMNWLDGVDGLSGGVTIIGAVTIFFLSLKPEVNQPPVGIITMALAGATLGFLIFNFYPAKILAGTSGSIFMGFILASLAIFAGTKIATALLVLSIPVIDFFFVIARRIKGGDSIFKPDKKHLHHLLMNIGWSQRKITVFFYASTILISLIALNTKALGKMVAIILIFGIMLVFFSVINKKLILNSRT